MRVTPYLYQNPRGRLPDAHMLQFDDPSADVPAKTAHWAAQPPGGPTCRIPYLSEGVLEWSYAS